VYSAFEKASDHTAFKATLRDFLVQLKEFSTGSNDELFLEETEAAQVSGIVR